MRALLNRLFADTIDLPRERLALVFAAGLVIGVFPVMGCPTAMCLAAAFVLRINPAPLLAINHISSPLQIALLIPLLRTGTWICGGEGTAAHPTLRVVFAILHAIAGWTFLCVPAGVMLYFVMLIVLRSRRRFRLTSVEIPA